MRVHISTDHAAFDTKQYLVTELARRGYEVVDHGAGSLDPDDDYPDFIIPCAEAVLADPGSLGIVLGGSGNGEAIAANKVVGMRAALAYDPETARLGREHNNALCLALGGRMHPEPEALEIVLTFLATPFSGSPRHERRIAKITAYEQGRS
ncbi:MAG: ribose-5-phosphate isomerase [Actinomycetia bacterium]|nr:ribose-5-phosphate isomerase [Actinomycetes bacterium]